LYFLIFYKIILNLNNTDGVLIIKINLFNSLIFTIEKIPKGILVKIKMNLYKIIRSLYKQTKNFVVAYI